MRRRAFLGLALLAAGCTTGDRRGLRIAAGEPGGFYVEFAQLLAKAVGATEPELTAEVLTTAGSVANLELVRRGRAELGLALTTVATGPELRAIGRVYENYMQLVVPADSPVHSVAELRDRRISLGAKGSGAAVFGERLLHSADVGAIVTHHPLRQAAEELAAGRIDALLWSGGVPTPELAKLDRQRPVRLVDITDQLTALNDPVYQRVVVPHGGYGDPDRDTDPVETIGVPNLLVTHRALPDEVAAAVVRVLVREAPRLVPSQALGTQYLDQRSLITTHGVRMHPGAAAAYRDLRG